jgi:hypothetical protein
MQRSVIAHARPQAPQLRLSFWRSTQTPAQLLSIPQVAVQAPATQNCPAGHRIPQRPQLLGSMPRSMQ